jgi:hypothetical protein
MKHMKTMSRPRKADTVESFQDIASVVMTILQALVPKIAAKLRAEQD